MPTAPPLRGAQGTSNDSYSSGSSTFSQHSSTQVGDLLVHFQLFIIMQSVGGTASFDSISTPSGWQVLPGFPVLLNVGGAYPMVIVGYYREAATAGAATHTQTMAVTTGGANIDRRGVTLAYSGHRPIGVDGGPFTGNPAITADDSDSTGTSRSIDAAAITPVNPATSEVAVFATSDTGTEATETVTPPSGMTTQGWSDYTAASTMHALLVACAATLASGASTGIRNAVLAFTTSSRTYVGAFAAHLAIRAPNTLPSSPGAFTVPSSGQVIPVGTVVNVDFGDATDADNDPLLYSVEYSFNGGAWTPMIGSLGSSGFAWDTAGWTPGSYQLRAYASDSYAFSAAPVVSSTFTLVSGGPRLIHRGI